MATWRVYEKEGSEAEKVKVGFNWWAFLIPGLWALAKGLPIAGPLGLAVQVAAPLRRVDPVGVTTLVSGIVLGLVYGFKGNDWVASRLIRKGYRFSGFTVDTNIKVAPSLTEQRNTSIVEPEPISAPDDPEDELAWFELGIAHFESGKYNKAVEAFKEALRIDPEDAMAWNNLGFAYSKLNQQDKVKEAHERLKELDPEMADSFFKDHLQWASTGLPPPDRTKREHENISSKAGYSEQQVKETRPALNKETVWGWAQLGYVLAVVVIALIMGYVIKSTIDFGSESELTHSELIKITGRASISRFEPFFEGNIYNGNSNVTVTKLTLVVHTTNSGKKSSLSYVLEKEIAPLSAENFRIRVLPGDFDGWEISDGRGRNN